MTNIGCSSFGHGGPRKVQREDHPCKTGVVCGLLKAIRAYTTGRPLRDVNAFGAWLSLTRVQSIVLDLSNSPPQPGNVALDGTGSSNSPFPAALVKGLRTTDRNLTSVMVDVRKDVLAATGGKQVPWDHSSLTGDFYIGRRRRECSHGRASGGKRHAEAARGSREGASAQERPDCQGRRACAG